MSANYTKDWTITVSKNDVYFDIDYLSLKYAETSGGENPVRDDNVATETADGGSKRIVKRLCDHRASDIRTLLAKYIKSENTAAGTDAFADANWVYILSISTEADGNTLSSLADLIHDYIVNGALNDYYAQLGVNGNREALQIRAKAAYEGIRQLIYFRPMP